MNLKNHILSKKGSYFVEAGITLPIFILSVVAMALIINIISICENVGFVLSMEIKDLDIEANIKPIEFFDKTKLEYAVLDSNEKLNTFSITKYRYKFRNNGIDDLILVESRASFKVNNPIGIIGKVDYDLSILTRAFTGKTERASPLEESGFHEGNSEICYIFPKYGERYHRTECVYVTSVYKDVDNHIEITIEEAIRKGYTPCKVCGGE